MHFMLMTFGYLQNVLSHSGNTQTHHHTFTRI